MIKVKSKIYLSAQEAAELIDRSTQFIYMNHKKYWNAFSYGGSIMFDEEELQKWMKNQLRRVSK